MKQELEFITDEDLKLACKNVMDSIERATELAENDPYRNVIDPFSAVFEASFNNISLSDWMNREMMRQVQKSWQNSIGTFHQNVIGHISGLEDLGTGSVIDVKSSELKILAEIKNKHNTTKGNHKTAVYDDLENLLGRPEYAEYTGYYVAILTKKRVNKPFTPSDNKQNEQRPSNSRIREIDGRSFYAMITNDEDAIQKLYNKIPALIAEIKSFDPDNMYKDELYTKLFDEAFK